MVQGQDNIIQPGASDITVVGSFNNVGSTGSTVNGYTNVVSGNSVVLTGSDNTVNADNVVAFGVDGQSLDTANQIVVGDSNGVPQSPNSYITTTYDLLTTDLIPNNKLVPGATYAMYDVYGQGIFLTALSTNTINTSGSRTLWCPVDYTPGATVNTFTSLGVWNSTLTPAATELAIWGARWWQNNTGVNGTPIDDETLSTDWTLIDKDQTSYYTLLNFRIDYNLEGNFIAKQYDDYGNVIGDGTFHTIVSITLTDITDWNMNTYATFVNNNCYAVFNNSSTGLDITNNSNTGYIKNNSNTGAIFSNSNNGNIENNSNGSISYNSNNARIDNNSNTGHIKNNSNTGVIFSNSNNGNINNNGNLGAIVSNTSALTDIAFQSGNVKVVVSVTVLLYLQQIRRLPAPLRYLTGMLCL